MSATATLVLVRQLGSITQRLEELEDRSAIAPVLTFLHGCLGHADSRVRSGAVRMLVELEGPDERCIINARDKDRLQSDGASVSEDLGAVQDTSEDHGIFRMGVMLEAKMQDQARICRAAVSVPGVVSATIEGSEVVVLTTTRTIVEDPSFMEVFCAKLDGAICEVSGASRAGIADDQLSPRCEPSYSSEESIGDQVPLREHSGFKHTPSISTQYEGSDDKASNSPSEWDEPEYLDDEDCEEVNDGERFFCTPATNLLPMQSLQVYHEDSSLSARLHRAREQLHRTRQEQERCLLHVLAVLSHSRSVAQ